MMMLVEISNIYEEKNRKNLHNIKSAKKSTVLKY